MVQPTFSLGVLGAIYDGQRILLVKTVYSDGKWQLPGGYVEAFEDIEVALHREIKEELGVDSRILGTVGTYIRQEDHNIALVFEIALADGSLKLQESEISEAAYFEGINLPKKMSARTRTMVHDALNRKRGQVRMFSTINDPGKSIL